MSVTAAGRGRPRPAAVRELRLARRRCVFWDVDEEFDAFGRDLKRIAGRRSALRALVERNGWQWDDVSGTGGQRANPLSPSSD